MGTTKSAELISKAKAALILDQPFFASLVLGMPVIEDASVKTLCTNGDEIRYNPDFIGTLTHSETVFVLAHEAMHCVFQHMTRRGERNPNRWNIAGDYVINGLLSSERVGSMPDGCLFNPELVNQGNGTTEGVYGLLPEETEKLGPGDQGGALDEVKDAGSSGEGDSEAEGKGEAKAEGATMAQKDAEIRVRVIQAANAAKMCGKLSAGLARIVKEFTASRTDWKAILRRFLSERAKVDLSYSRPKRRFLAEDLCLPSLTGEKLGSVVIAVDCSGSVSPEILNSFAAEIKAIIQDVSPALVNVVYFDSEVLKRDTFTQDDSFEIKAVGGGGTAFSPIFRHIDTEELSPVACVVLTDLECSDFGTMPSYPVLWAATQVGQAPFGEVVLIKE